MRSAVAVLLASLALAGVAAAAEDAAAPAVARSDVERGFVAAAEGAQATAVGRIGAVRRVDTHGFAAPFVIERALSGPLAPGSSLTVTWEELAASRPVRFAEGDRVLVALGPLPTGSLWTSRFPRRDAWVVAARSEAFVADPDATTLDRLAAWLALPAAERGAGAGVLALARLVADAQPRVAASALARLAEVPGVGAEVTGDAAAALAGVIGAATPRPLELRRALLGLVASRHIAALRGAAETLAAQPGPLEAPALEAVAAIDGGLPPKRVAAVLARPEAELRAVAVRSGGAAVDRERLAGLARSDPAAAVRAAAVQELLARHGATVLDLAEPVLMDSDPSVRAAAASSIGALGAPAVPRLRVLAERSAGPDAAGPLAALWQAGLEGQAVVRSLASSHPDEQARRLCRLLTGQEQPH